MRVKLTLKCIFYYFIKLNLKIDLKFNFYNFIVLILINKIFFKGVKTQFKGVVILF